MTDELTLTNNPHDAIRIMQRKGYVVSVKILANTRAGDAAFVVDLEVVVQAVHQGMLGQIMGDVVARVPLDRGHGVGFVEHAIQTAYRQWVEHRIGGA